MTAGPDAGWEIELRAGRHLVGRARHCAVVIDDPAVEPYHVLLTIDHEGGSTSSNSRGEHRSQPRRVTWMSATRGSSLGTRSQVAGLVLGVTVPDPLDGGGGEPVVVDVDTLAIVDDHPELARGQAIVRSLQLTGGKQGLTAPDCVLTAPGDPALDDCTSILEIGARWRAPLDTDVSQPEHQSGCTSPARQTPFMSGFVARTCPQTLT